MRRSTYVFIVGAIFLIVILNFLPSKKPPKIPPDQLHRVDITDKVCLECHGEGKENSLSKKHPIKINHCISCHNT